MTGSNIDPAPDSWLTQTLNNCTSDNDYGLDEREDKYRFSHKVK